jgi:DNA polymerase I-like protein with 3'-5' exonuclease and polymerase domains
MFKHGGITKHLYGAKVLENMTQALARIIIMDLAMRMGKRFAHQVHDELIYVVKKTEAVEFVRRLRELAVIRPGWGTDLPIAFEVKVGPNYGELITF